MVSYAARQRWLAALVIVAAAMVILVWVTWQIGRILFGPLVADVGTARSPRPSALDESRGQIQPSIQEFRAQMSDVKSQWELQRSFAEYIRKQMPVKVK